MKDRAGNALANLGRSYNPRPKAEKSPPSPVIKVDDDLKLVFNQSGLATRIVPSDRACRVLSAAFQRVLGMVNDLIATGCTVVRASIAQETMAAMSMMEWNYLCAVLKEAGFEDVAFEPATKQYWFVRKESDDA